MLSYANVLSYQKLQRSKRAWCPACFNEWARDEGIIYEPLLWAIEVVTVCAHHQQPLSNRCAHCGQQQLPLTPKTHPGYCSKCQSWLGAPIEDSDDQYTALCEADLKQQLWVTEAVGEMLATAPRLIEPPTMEMLISRLKLCIDQTAWGRVNAFAAESGVWHGKLRRLIKHKRAPVLPLLLRICAHLDLPVTDLLVDTKELIFPRTDNVLESLNRHRARQSYSPRPEGISFTEAGLVMKEALTENPPTSMRQIQQRTGKSGDALKRHYPALYAEIVKRYRDFHCPYTIDIADAATALKAALKENPPPSLQSVFRRLGCRSTGYRFYAQLPKLCRAVSARYQNHRNHLFNAEAVQLVLETALIEDPAPSLSEVVRRLSHRRQFIKNRFPELTTAIVTRFLTQRRARREERLTLLRIEIEKAVRVLVAEGLNPSEARIQSQLSRYGNSADFKRVLLEVKTALGLVR
jgi:uncharacterized protein YneF (UPF0154 family)